MSSTPVYTNDYYGNSFSKIALCIGAVWVGSVLIKNMLNPSVSQQYHQDKRYTVKSENPINKQIFKKNIATKVPPKVDIFTRNKRFNRYF